MNTFFDKLGRTALIFGVDLLSMIFRAFVLTRLWLWFIVPLGAVPINKVEAYGLSLFVSMFTFIIFLSQQPVKDETVSRTTRIIQNISGSAGVAATAWLVGYVLVTYIR